MSHFTGTGKYTALLITRRRCTDCTETTRQRLRTHRMSNVSDRPTGISGLSCPWGYCPGRFMYVWLLSFDNYTVHTLVW